MTNLRTFFGRPELLLALGLTALAGEAAAKPATKEQLVPPSAPAAVAAAPRLIEKLTLPALHKLMKQAGYEVEIDNDVDAVEWHLNTLTGHVSIADDGASLQFHTAFGDSHPSTERVNAWNAGHRYSRSFVDDEGNPHLMLDLDLVGGVTVARLEDYFLTCAVSFAAWIKEVVIEPSEPSI